MKLFSPFQIKNMTLRNRVVMPPMCMYSAENGMPNAFHFTHYTSRAVGGVGLIIIEATGVMPNGRISDHCLGLWNDEQMHALTPARFRMPAPRREGRDSAQPCRPKM